MIYPYVSKMWTQGLVVLSCYDVESDDPTFHSTIVSSLAYDLLQLSLFCQICRTESMVGTILINPEDPGSFCAEQAQHSFD